MAEKQHTKGATVTTKKRVGGKKKKSNKKNKRSQQPSVWKQMRDFVLGSGEDALKKREIVAFSIGVMLFVFAAVMLLSFVSALWTGPQDQSTIEGAAGVAHNVCGELGMYLAHEYMNGLFGVASLIIPIFFIALAMRLIGAYRVRLIKCFLHCSLVMIWTSVALSLAQTLLMPVEYVQKTGIFWGGAHGDNVLRELERYIGYWGAALLLVLVALLYLTYISKKTLDWVRAVMRPKDWRLLERFQKDEPENENLEEENFSSEPLPVHDPQPVQVTLLGEDGAEVSADDVQPQTDEVLEEKADEVEFAIQNTEAPDAQPEETQQKDEEVKGKTAEDVLNEAPYDPRADLPNYKFPSLTLLKASDESSPSIDMEEQKANKERIITVLRNFKVEITKISATVGPTITLYEITPAPGVRINKIRNLEDDIALGLAAAGIRIIAPIPGKGTVGIEVPNQKKCIVSMESILNSRTFADTNYELPIALGKTIMNEVFMVDLAKLPHLLVAGATGQGKSVGLNAIITSLLYKRHPAELKFVMVDPKKVEFTPYTLLENHYLAKIPGDGDAVITDVTKVVETLRSLCQLMDHRYDLLKKARVRNIKEYNAKFLSRQLSPANGHEFLPYIVVIIDEFGDLIMTAGKEIELPIARLAQLARAIGIHLIIATQRPTTNIITGLIKNNFPARIAFRVTQRIDSQTILDRTGANQLIGKGDMLFLNGGDPVRVQCAFVDTPEVEEINRFIADQMGYPEAFELPEPAMENDNDGGSREISASELDSMFEEVARLVVAEQQGSTSFIQRKFSIGFARSGRITDQLERAGIVGPQKGPKPREVLVQDIAELEMILANLGK